MNGILQLILLLAGSRYVWRMQHDGNAVVYLYDTQDNEQYGGWDSGTDFHGDIPPSWVFLLRFDDSCNLLRYHCDSNSRFLLSETLTIIEATGLTVFR